MRDEADVYVLWKDEDDVGGVPIGPAIVAREDYNISSKRWVTRSEAQGIAELLGWKFEEV